MNHSEASLLSYIFNSLWQVSFLFVVAWILARGLRKSRPELEHRLWVGALVLEVLVPACSLSPVELFRSLAQWIPRIVGRNGEGYGPRVVATAQATAYIHGTLGLPSKFLTGIVAAYFVGLVYFGSRFAWGLWQTHVLYHRSVATPLSGPLKSRWEQYRSAFQIHDAVCAVSNDICGPVTVGIRRKVLLVPAGLEEALSEEDLNAAMAHEFAHMRRQDFGKNIFYQLLAMPIAYHPLLRLTLRYIAETREMVCDAVAADAAAGRERYAKSLLRLASSCLPAEPATQVHAIGIFDANTLERRIMNLTKKPFELRGALRVAVPAVCLLLGVGACTSALALRMKVFVPAFQDGGAPTGPVRVAAGVMAGQLLAKADPIYPQEARDAKISGEVVLHARIGTNGHMQSLEIVSGPPELQAAALDAVKQWVYRPFLLNGNPVAVDTTVTVNFQLF